MNEKYAGDLLLQKTFTADHLTKKKMKNTGQLPMYHVENAHAVAGFSITRYANFFAEIKVSFFIMLYRVTGYITKHGNRKCF